jgi:hypothetical protein
VVKLRDSLPKTMVLICSRLTEFATVATAAIHTVGGDRRQMGCTSNVRVFGILGSEADFKEVTRAIPC